MRGGQCGAVVPAVSAVPDCQTALYQWRKSEREVLCMGTGSGCTPRSFPGAAPDRAAASGQRRTSSRGTCS